jgi:hypothetical protein
MDIGKRALNLATALVLGAVIVGLLADSAEAAPRRPTDDGTRCIQYGGWGGDYTFYMPGDVITDASGRKLRCGSDGEWHVVKTTGPLVPGQLPGNTFEQAP